MNGTGDLKMQTSSSDSETLIGCKPPPDTQRTERRGERGIQVAMGCYLLQDTPLSSSPTVPTPLIPRLSHRLRPCYQD
jgi:hypothetical protein